MYRIGEFSYLCSATLRTIRHYHKLGLIEPVMVDKYTGYRYYDDTQVKKYLLIKKLQEAGLSLNEIKKMLNNLNVVDLEKEIVKIHKEAEEKIEILEEIIKKGKVDRKLKINFELNKDMYIIGRYKLLKRREDADNLLNLEEFKNKPRVFINFEKNYKEKDIAAFIGYKITKDEGQKIPKEYLVKNDLEILYNQADKVKTVIHMEDNRKNNLENEYANIIKFAGDNNIQIRGEYYEIVTANKREIYVEAYDLKVINKAAESHNQYLKRHLTNTYPCKFVGTWELQGEVIELPRYFNIKKQHYMPDTVLNTLELKNDGTTNFNYITWKENYLIIQVDDITIYNQMISHDQYLELLINSKESNARPYCLFYKKKENTTSF